MTGLVSAEEAAQEYSFDEYVVTANRIPVKATEVAANVTVITSEEIEKGGYTRISDALRSKNVNTGSTSFGAYPVLNGDDRVLILVDGRRMNFPHLMFSGNDRVMNIDGISVENIERIEIVRGAGSALYGSDAVGGVINIITKKAVKDQTTVATEFGNWGFKRQSLVTEGKSNDIGYLFTAEHKTRDNFEYKDAATGQDKKQGGSKIDQDLLTLRLDKELDQESDLSFQWEHKKDQGGFSVAVKSSGDLYYPDGKQDISDNNVALTYRWNKNNSAPDFVRVYRNSSKGTFYNSLEKNDHSPYTYDINSNGVEWQQNWQINEQYSLVGGANWIEDHLDDQDSINKSMTTKSLYLENRWQLPSSWTLSAGTRYEDQSYAGEHVTSRLSINREISEKTNVYASWGQYVRNPTMFHLFNKTQFMIGNPNLKPEEGNTVTLGLNTELGDGTKLQTSVYSSHLKNALSWKSEWPLPGYYHNIDREKRQGFDLTLAKTLSPQWDVTAGYSYVQIKSTFDPVTFSSTTNYIDDITNTAPNGYHLGVHYKQDQWDAGLNLRAVSNRSTTKFSSDSYHTLDLNVSYQINPTTRIYGNAYNLNNEIYELFAQSGEYRYPMPGRSFYIGVEHRM
ncbi:colicin I receptor [Sporomusaceae bacterium FL31]|nr:colicin I receptor [Sporomusaceae bacterium FL31]GCE33116.1 colicin I receptor [Sporomusaceae bacterium]